MFEFHENHVLQIMEAKYFRSWDYQKAGPEISEHLIIKIKKFQKNQCQWDLIDRNLILDCRLWSLSYTPDLRNKIQINTTQQV